jgi:hypothetical protein
MSAIFDNAIISIELGVEDFRQNKHERNLSAIRNIYAGILLLYKEKLVRISPNGILIAAKIVPKLGEDNNVIFAKKGHQTIDVNGIKDRFREFNIRTDWQKLRSIQEVRNDLEHSHTNITKIRLRELIYDCFMLVKQFLVNELHENPSDLFSEETWAFLSTNDELYEREEELCKSSLLAADVMNKYLYLSQSHCPNCESSLVQFSGDSDIYMIEGRCLACGELIEGTKLLEVGVAQEHWGDNYMNVKDGGVSESDTCPECGLETYIRSKGICVACEFEFSGGNCNRCGISLSLDEHEFDGICSYCNHIKEKYI